MDSGAADVQISAALAALLVGFHRRKEFHGGRWCNRDLSDLSLSVPASRGCGSYECRRPYGQSVPSLDKVFLVGLSHGPLTMLDMSCCWNTEATLVTRVVISAITPAISQYSPQYVAPRLSRTGNFVKLLLRRCRTLAPPTAASRDRRDQGAMA